MKFDGSFLNHLSYELIKYHFLFDCIWKELSSIQLNTHKDKLMSEVFILSWILSSELSASMWVLEEQLGKQDKSEIAQNFYLWSPDRHVFSLGFYLFDYHKEISLTLASRITINNYIYSIHLFFLGLIKKLITFAKLKSIKFVYSIRKSKLSNQFFDIF